VYCKDGNRRGTHDRTAFTFLGFTFRARKARSRNGVNFTNFLRPDLWEPGGEFPPGDPTREALNGIRGL
jgi:hypothetical protein